MAKSLNLTVGKTYLTKAYHEGDLAVLQGGWVIGVSLPKGAKLKLTEIDTRNKVVTFEGLGGSLDKCIVYIRMHVARDLLESIEE